MVDARISEKRLPKSGAVGRYVLLFNKSIVASVCDTVALTSRIIPSIMHLDRAVTLCRKNGDD